MGMIDVCFTIPGHDGAPPGWMSFLLNSTFLRSSLKALAAAIIIKDHVVEVAFVHQSIHPNTLVHW
jgi:hypothetical protein